MTTLHARIVGDQAVLPREEFERLVELAGGAKQVEVRIQEDQIPAVGIMALAEQGGAFDFLEKEEELYTVADLIDKRQ